MDREERIKPVVVFQKSMGGSAPTRAGVLSSSVVIIDGTAETRARKLFWSDYALT
jgi:hypothetical protein